MADQKEEDPVALGELLEAKKLYDQSEAAIKELVSSGVLTPSQGKTELKTAQDALERTKVHVLQTNELGGRGGGAAGRVGGGRGLGISEKEVDTDTSASPLKQALQGLSPPNSSHDDFPLGTILEVLRLSDCLSVYHKYFSGFSVCLFRSFSVSVCLLYLLSLSPLSSTVIFVSTRITVFCAGASGYGRMVCCHHLWSQKQGLEIRSHVWW
jgi:hypothetical protein